MYNIRFRSTVNNPFSIMDFSDFKRYVINKIYSSVGLPPHPEGTQEISLPGDIRRSKCFIAIRNFTNKFSLLRLEMEQ